MGFSVKVQVKFKAYDGSLTVYAYNIMLTDILANGRRWGGLMDGYAIEEDDLAMLCLRHPGINKVIFVDDPS